MRRIVALALLVVLVSAVFHSAVLAQDPTDRETIIIPISLYILVSEEDAASDLASQREVDDLQAILDGMNELWSPADIQFEANHIGPLALSDDMLFMINRGAYRGFFEQVAYGLELPEPGVINGFFARDIGGPNGVVPYGSRIFFVMDEPTVADHRVASHETGHIIGLHHELADKDLLMFPGEDGLTLTEEEITVARYVAEGILIGLR